MSRYPRARRQKRKYRIKPRFVVFMAILVSVILGGAVYFLGTEEQETASPEELEAQRAQGWNIMMAARAYISNEDLRYDDGYYAGGYPPDDIGVCTDVVWKGFMAEGIVLRDLVDADIAANFEAYEDIISVRDPNIDFRLVPQLERFFERNAEVLSTDVDDYLAWQAGDIVTFESSHVAIVSNLRNLWGRPYIIQHGKDPAAEEDRIFASDGMKISGHFRWPLNKGKSGS